MKLDLKLAKLRYNQQKGQAVHRKDILGNPINWNLTFDEWLNIWITSNKWHLRGCGIGKYCMSRKGDLGDYSIDNVEIKEFTQNTSEGNLGRKLPQKGRKGPRGPYSEERKLAISKATKGRIPWNKGLKTGDMKCV